MREVPQIFLKNLEAKNVETKNIFPLQLETLLKGLTVFLVSHASNKRIPCSVEMLLSYWFQTSSFKKKLGISKNQILKFCPLWRNKKNEKLNTSSKEWKADSTTSLYFTPIDDVKFELARKFKVCWNKNPMRINFQIIDMNESEM